MKSIIEYMTISMKDAFAQAGYEADYGQVMLSNRPDLCDYQCNGRNIRSLPLSLRRKL